MLKAALISAVFALGTLSAGRAVEYSTAEISGRKATVICVNVKREKVRLFLRDTQGKPLKSFDGILTMLKPMGLRLVFAMNAGMYHADLSPVGLFADGGKQIAPLNLGDAEGNFFLKPNGVFVISASGAQVLESTELTSFKDPIQLATQSGPLLVRNGKIHPKFKPDSTFRLIRNGVGIQAPDTAIFVETDDVVNLHELALLFRDVLKCPDALFFDGTVSSIYAPELQRNEKRIDLGPMIGVVDDEKAR